MPSAAALPRLSAKRIIVAGNSYEDRAMHRILSLSVIAGLALGAAGVASAQSRTVSTADMPKPGVSYISGPSTPVRRETVSTGTLPQPAQLYVNGQPAGGYQDQGNGNGYGNGSYDNQ